jgi:hypothetical protein
MVKNSDDFSKYDVKLFAAFFNIFLHLYLICG